MHIDLWTLALQTINVLVLIWILQRFLYRPVTAMIARRQSATAAILADAESTRAGAKATEAEWIAKRGEIGQERERILAAARQEAEAARATLLEHAMNEVAARQGAAEAALVRDRDSIRRGLDQDAARLAVEIAAKLLARLPQRSDHGFLDGMLSQLAALGPDACRRLADEGDVELVSAALMSDADQASCRAAIAGAIGGNPNVRFRQDPNLIAGLELNASTIAVRNSWRADLDRITADLTRRESQGEPNDGPAELA